MADKKVTDLTEITDVADNDWHYLIDVSDTSEDAAGTGKKVQQSNIVDKLEALKLRLVADGAITAGQAVEFLEGKLKAGGGDNITQAAETTASTDDGTQISACVLSSTSFAVVFIAGAGTLQCIIGTISGTTISYGTEVQADASTACISPSVCALSSTKIAVSYGVSGTGGRAKLATISGTVPTFGSAVTFKSVANLVATNAVALSDSLFAVAYSDVTNALTQVIAATVSGTVPTFGSAVSVRSLQSDFNILVKMNSTTIIGYTTVTPTPAGLYFIFTYSSSTLTLVATQPSMFKEIDAAPNSFVKLNSDTIIQVFRGWDDYGYAQLLTRVNNEFKISETFRISSAALSDIYAAVTVLDENRAVALFNVTSTVVAYLLEIQGDTVIVKNSATVVSISGATSLFMLTPDPGKFIALTKHSLEFKSRLSQVSKFMGIAATTVADAGTAVAVVRGVSSAHSGLTVGALYYTDSAGTISTDDSGRFLGVAVSSTKILLQNSLDRATASRSDLIDSIPVAYTPTFTGFGTVSGVNAKSWRIGSELFFEITFTVGTSTATEARISLGFKGVNSAVTTSTDYSTLQAIGTGGISNGIYIALVLAEASKTYVTFGYLNGTFNGLAKRDGADFTNSGSVFSFKGSVKIAGW